MASLALDLWPVPLEGEGAAEPEASGWRGLHNLGGRGGPVPENGKGPWETAGGRRTGT